MAAYSPINAYYVPLDAKILASITPAERLEIARWVRQPAKPGGHVTSPYIKEVVATLGEKIDILMAIDLEGAWGVPTISRFLANNEIKEIPLAQVDKVAGLLGTLKGLTLDVRVDKDITGLRDHPARPGCFGTGRQCQADHARRAQRRGHATGRRARLDVRDFGQTGVRRRQAVAQRPAAVS